MHSPIRVHTLTRRKLPGGKGVGHASVGLPSYPVRIVSEPENLQQLIADCAEIPQSLDAHPAVLLPRPAPRWEVDDSTQAQVDDIDDYV